jgi:colanic acid biosynthesis protein WcaH
MAKEKGSFIPDPLFNQIVKLLPIASVEALIVIDKSLLLLKRNNEPAKGLWWFPGGRIHKGESLKETLCREILEETGLHLETFKLINVYSRAFPERHDITIVFLCTCKEGKIKVDSEHSEYKLFKEMPHDLHPFLAETICDSKWESSYKVESGSKD